MKELNEKLEKLKFTRTDIEKTEKYLKDLKEEERKLSGEEIPEMMAELGVFEFTTDTEKISLNTKYRGHIKKDNIQAAVAILTDRGLEGAFNHVIEVKEALTPNGKSEKSEAVIDFLDKYCIDFTEKLDIHWQTLSSIIKEQEVKGTPLPADIFGTFRVIETKIKEVNK